MGKGSVDDDDLPASTAKSKIKLQLFLRRDGRLRHEISASRKILISVVNKSAWGNVLQFIFLVATQLSCTRVINHFYCSRIHSFFNCHNIQGVHIFFLNLCFLEKHSKSGQSRNTLVTLILCYELCRTSRPKIENLHLMCLRITFERFPRNLCLGITQLTLKCCTYPFTFTLY